MKHREEPLEPFEETDWSAEADLLAADMEADRDDVMAQFDMAIRSIDDKLELLKGTPFDEEY